MTKFIGDWNSLEDMARDFQIDRSVFEGKNILFAWYVGDYSMDAYVLYEEGGTYYEVNGGHCSCYGLEGQWEPEEVEWDSLLIRVEKGYFDWDGGTAIREIYNSVVTYNEEWE